ncbi:MAG: hypothetical protein Q7S59_01100, partial [Sulfurimonas sp.]|nr:hypothetical protein [Sulfurimonas sp.]
MEIKIFLAHTSEVNEDIEQIQNSIYTKYQKDDKVKLIIEHWTDADKSLSPDRFQERLNELLGTCEILYVFFHNRIGDYTKEEFTFGFERLKVKQKPYSMSVFSKEFQISNKASKEERREANEAINFADEVKELHDNQYVYSYQDIHELKNQLLHQLEKDIEKLILPQVPIADISEFFS